MLYDLQKDILEATKYVSGYENKDDDYVISASMVGNDPLQNYLALVHGKIESKKIDDSTLGSVFHKGMEDIMRDKQLYDIGEKDKSPIYGIEHSMDMKLSNGWVLSGTADLIVEPTPSNFELRDYKLTKGYAHKMFLTEKYLHNYTKQLQALEALFRKGGKRPEVINSVTLIVDYFIKDSKALEYELAHRPEIAPNKQGTEDVRAAEVTLMEIVEITNVLQNYIESGTIPPQCADVWGRNVKGNYIPTRCAVYCSYNHVCPYYDVNTRTATNLLAGW